jgi:hypothetical protein
VRGGGTAVARRRRMAPLADPAIGLDRPQRWPQCGAGERAGYGVVHEPREQACRRQGGKHVA